MPNYKKAKYRDPAHPEHQHYIAHGIRMDDRRRKQLAARATVRRYHIPGENGANKYLLRNGSMISVAKKMAVMATAGILGALVPPKTGIHRSQ